MTSRLPLSWVGQRKQLGFPQLHPRQQVVLFEPDPFTERAFPVALDHGEPEDPVNSQPVPNTENRDRTNENPQAGDIEVNETAVRAMPLSESGSSCRRNHDCCGLKNRPADDRSQRSQ